RAVLKAPVDLLWNGGIGTYVKASTESNADVGDKGNDPIRVDGKDLRVRVIGEGGNLGMTPLGRIEAALHGIKNNTDAIDNSAGVDTSDHEVNIKILLNGLVADGDMTVKQRNKLLAEMTDEVGTMVLRSNYAQNTAIANALAQSKDMLHAQQRFLKHLVREGHLDRALEFLPTDRQIRERLAAGQGLTGPETAVLLAYTKITVAEELLHTSLPDDPYLKVLLHAYFPTALRERFLDRIDTHPLRREITTTVLVNDTVNTGGTTYLHRMREETGASLEEIVRAQTAARAIFRAAMVWDGVEALDNKVEADVQTRIRLHSRRLVERGTRWLLNNRPQPLALGETVSFFSERVELVWSQLPKLLRGADLEWYQKIHDELTGVGVGDELATRVAGFSSAFPTLDIVSVADHMGKEPLDVPEVYYDLADRLRLTQLMDRISELPRTDRWQSMARAAIREDLYAAHAALTAEVLAVGNGTSTPSQRFEVWEERNAALLGRARTTLEEIQSSDTFDLANLSVAMRTMRTLLRQPVGRDAPVVSSGGLPESRRLSGRQRCGLGSRLARGLGPGLAGAVAGVAGELLVLLEDVLRRPVHAQFTALQPERAVAGVADGLVVVADQEDRAGLLAQLPDAGLRTLAEGPVAGGQRLVDEQHVVVLGGGDGE